MSPVVQPHPPRARRPRARRVGPALGLALLCAAWPPAVGAAPVRTPESVLVLHSYSADFAWTLSQQEGIDSVFGRLDAEYDLRIEYLDAVHHPELVGSPTLLELLRSRLRDQRLRVVLTSDNAALAFARAHRAELFPGASIVFMGVNGYDDGMLRGDAGITGVAEDTDLAGTLDVILRLRPGTRRIVFPGMVDDVTYRAIRTTVARDLAALPADVATAFPEYPDVDAALEDLRNLSPDAAIVVMSNMRTANGEGITSQRVVELVSASAPVPVFTNWDFVVGHGAVGGSVISGVEQGRRAAEIALRVLRGARPEDIPVHRGVGRSFSFDHRQLARFGIPVSRLPPGARVLNSPERSYRVPREAAWTAAISFGVLLAAVAGLVLARRHGRRVEAELREANERFSAILRAATDYSVMGTDPEGRITVFSEGARQLLGYSEAEALGRSPVELVHDPAEIAARAAELGVAPGFEALAGVARRVGTETREWTYRRKDGQRLTVSVTVAPMRGRRGELIGFFGIGRDVTGQRQVEQQLLQSQKMESVGLLAGGVAHDFNNLLTPILGHTSLLLSDLAPGDPRAEVLLEVQTAARRASRVTSQLLAFSRKQLLELRTLDLGDVVRGTERLLRGALGETIQVEIEVAPDVDPVRADLGQMQQVLLNLALNARDAMPTGGTLRIHARSARIDQDHAAQRPEVHPGSYAVLEVSDTGAGMPPEVQAHLFEPFFTTKERGKGTGLGLSTVYGIVKQHGGGVTVYSEPGRGTTFRIYLPTAQGRPEKEPQAPGTAEVPRGAGETVLVVEDSDVVRRVACDMLRRLGYHVLSAGDGREAVEIARAGERIDLLLSDVVLPGMNGKEVATQLRERRPELHVLYMSGYDEGTIVHGGAIDAGVHFIQKPLSYDVLARKTREALACADGR